MKLTQINSLPKITTKRARRVGRGSGSGRGKTAGRGTKGQKARGTIRSGFEGGQLPLIKRLPLYRGKGRNKSFRKKPLPVNLKVLAHLPPKTVVTEETLVRYNILRREDIASFGVKILGDGELTKPLEIRLPISKSARAKVEKAGGTVTEKSAVKAELVQQNK